MTQNDGHSRQTTAPTRGLEISVSPGIAAAGRILLLLLFTVFWCSITAVFVNELVKSFRTSQPDYLLLLMMQPFVLAAVLLIVSVFLQVALLPQVRRFYDPDSFALPLRIPQWGLVKQEMGEIVVQQSRLGKAAGASAATYFFSCGACTVALMFLFVGDEAASVFSKSHRVFVPGTALAPSLIVGLTIAGCAFAAIVVGWLVGRRPAPRFAIDVDLGKFRLTTRKRDVLLDLHNIASFHVRMVKSPSGRSGYDAEYNRPDPVAALLAARLEDGQEQPIHLFSQDGDCQSMLLAQWSRKPFASLCSPEEGAVDPVPTDWWLARQLYGDLR